MIPDIDTLGLLDDEEIELDFAALALSACDHPGTDLGGYVTLLERVSDRLGMVGATAATVPSQAGALVSVFAGEFGFEGDVTSYDAPLNADMMRVLDRRRGLPVSLAILYVAAARRMGWAAHPLNTPGHVLVRIGDGPAMMIDPFSGGRPVDRAGLDSLLRRVLGPLAILRPDHIAPLSNRMVLVRLLVNQASRAEQTGDAARALTLYGRMTQVAPDHGDGWWERARLALLLRDFAVARESLSAMLEVTRDPSRRADVAAALDGIAQA